MKASHGEYIATLDADLQDPPSLLPQMVQFLEEHEDYVIALLLDGKLGVGSLQCSFFMIVLSYYQ